MGTKTVLGKGLASLLPGASLGLASQPPGLAFQGAGAVVAGAVTTTFQAEASNRDRHLGISLAGLDEIVVSPYQPRRDFDQAAIEELAQSIRANGLIQPLVVRKTAQGYELIAGERRLRASRLAGLKAVPIVIRRATDREALELALIENIQRQDLNCVDTALAYLQLVQDFALTQEEVALRVGKDRATVANHLRLLRLPEAVIDDLRRQILTFGHGKVLLSLDGEDLRLEVRKQIVERHLSVRETEALADELKKERLGATKAATDLKPAANVLTSVASRLASIAQDLTRQWSARVEVRGTERRGKITLHYASASELERILGAMQNDKLWANPST